MGRRIKKRTYLKKLEDLILKAKKDGYTMFVDCDRGFVIADTEDFVGAEDLREVEGESISLDRLAMCGTPALPRMTQSGNG